MFTLAFSGLGTQWRILVDGDPPGEEVKKRVVKVDREFEARFTRFRDDSEVGKINLGGDGEYQVSDELARILRFGLKLSEDSDGAFDPKVATVLVAFGYDKNLELKPEARPEPPPGKIKLSGQRLTLSGGAKLDLGGWGKGYLIDRLYEFLLSQKIKYFLIDGGGDFRGTCKADGSAWRIALEHPLDPSLAIGVIKLKNSAFANSGVGKRKLGRFHHLIDPTSGNPVRNILSSHVAAKTAVVADGLATALLVSPKEMRSHLAALYQVEYLLLDEKMKPEKSAGFIGEIYNR